VYDGASTQLGVDEIPVGEHPVVEAMRVEERA
jgi:hypothetical protein